MVVRVLWIRGNESTEKREYLSRVSEMFGWTFIASIYGDVWYLEVTEERVKTTYASSKGSAGPECEEKEAICHWRPWLFLPVVWFPLSDPTKSTRIALSSLSSQTLCPSVLWSNRGRWHNGRYLNFWNVATLMHLSLALWHFFPLLLLSFNDFIS